ncbi:reticulon-4 isoform X1 [Diorhabda carinulata]|uniref:reticulon-4 isoform X1 n=1 Tax=Diorhabda carinulata TaxID=1163345 RepID=UPI0025A1B8CA|nr:reticulon-4 isoform X1 [Diorhabda carinulata]
MEHSKETEQGLFNIKREVDSMDDFEHLEHDSSPLQDLLGLKSDKEVTAPKTVHEINNTPKTAVSDKTGGADLLASLEEPLIPEKMNRNLLEDDFLESEHNKDKLDQFLHSPFDHGDNKLSSANLIEAEKVSEPQKKEVDQFSDFEQNVSDFKSKLPEDTFKPEPTSTPPVHPIEPEITVSPSVQVPERPVTNEPEKTIPTATAPVVEKKVEIQENITKNVIADKPAVVTPAKIAPTDAAAIFCQMGLDLKKMANEVVQDVINGVQEANILTGNDKETCCQRSLLCVLFNPNAWFNPEKLDPKVESLIYWRNPKKSGPVFGGVLVVLLALTYFSLISVVAYLSFFALGVTVAFRIYKNIVQAIQKTGDGHPFKEYLELDISLSQDKVNQFTAVAVAHINAAIFELRRLFLVEDLVDSIKFGVLLWTLTYVGAWFNGMTLIIIGWVALFTLPKVYEANKTQIDANLEVVRTKLAEITTKIKAAVPVGKKGEEKKEQ